LVQIAVEKFSEATVGYRENREVAEKWVRLFSTPYFVVTPVSNSFCDFCQFYRGRLLL
jgi:glycerol-3-phosphate dehydrogenase (NAD+)